jgi:hypothetical protein
MGALKPALTGRLISAMAVCFAIAVALFMCGGVGNAAAEEIVIEVPTALAVEDNATAATGVYYGLTVVQWVIAAAGLLALVAFFLMRDFRILIVAGVMLIVLVVMEYL